MRNNKYGRKSVLRQISTYAGCVAAAGAAGLVGFACWRYKVARPTQMLARTGWGVEGVEVLKQGLQLPFQCMSRFSIEPVTYETHLEAMSEERIPFVLPGVFTVGPINEPEALQRYAETMIDLTEEERRDIIMGIIAGECRIRTATLPLDIIFNDREQFRDTVTDLLNENMSPYGIQVYNANIRELKDTPGTDYFSEQRKRALEKVANEARISVAEAQREGEVGAKLHERDARIQVAELERDAILAENERRQEISESKKNLNVARACYRQEQEIADYESDAAAEQRKNELQQSVEQQRRTQQLERKRADGLTDAEVKAEVSIAGAHGEADAKIIIADAELYATERQADAELYAAKNQAEAILLLREAEALGLDRLVQAAGGTDMYVLTQLTDGENSVLVDIATQQAEAVRDMDLTIWQQTSSSDSPMQNLVQSLPSMIDGLKPYGIDLSEWFPVDEIDK